MHNSDDMKEHDSQPATKGDLNRFAATIGLDRFATKIDLDRFATKIDLDRFATKIDLDRFATKIDLDRFATKTDLEQFAKKTDLERFATKDDLEQFSKKTDLEQFAKKTDLDRFATKDDLNETRRTLAIEIVKTQADVREIKETMATKNDMERILVAVEAFAGKAQVYDRAAVLHGRALTEAEVTLRDHEKRLRAIETRET